MGLISPLQRSNASLGKMVPHAIRCLCCVTRSGLVSSLRRLFARRAQGEIEFDQVLIETLPALLTPDVALPGGGRLWIERTRALTAIDIDGPDPSRANWDAVTAIPRQLRLRNIGGLIVVDFAGSPSRPEALLGRLRDGFDGDSASVRFGGGISALGVADLARQRRGRSLADVFPDGAP